MQKAKGKKALSHLSMCKKGWVTSHTKRGNRRIRRPSGGKTKLMLVEKEMSIGCPSVKTGSWGYCNCLGWLEIDLKDEIGIKAVQGVRLPRKSVENGKREG